MSEKRNKSFFEEKLGDFTIKRFQSIRITDVVSDIVLELFGKTIVDSICDNAVELAENFKRVKKMNDNFCQQQINLSLSLLDGNPPFLFFPLHEYDKEANHFPKPDIKNKGKLSRVTKMTSKNQNQNKELNQSFKDFPSSSQKITNKIKKQFESLQKNNNSEFIEIEKDSEKRMSNSFTKISKYELNYRNLIESQCKQKKEVDVIKNSKDEFTFGDDAKALKIKKFQVLPAPKKKKMKKIEAKVFDSIGNKSFQVEKLKFCSKISRTLESEPQKFVQRFTLPVGEVAESMMTMKFKRADQRVGIREKINKSVYENYRYSKGLKLPQISRDYL